MRAVRIGGILLVCMLAGCGATKPAPPGEPPQTGSGQAGPAAAAPVAPPVTPPSPPPSSPPPRSIATPDAAAATAPTEHPVTPPSTAESAAKAAPPAAKSPAKAPAPAAQPQKKEAVAPESTKPKAEPPLDLTSLETRLKETKAIGVMTKIALKNQVDDLLNQFRAFYQGKLKTTLAELRRPFDLLILKVLSLLQDSDPTLAAAIAASREAIWGILSDPVKFATI
jgi:hypothetical protein